MLPWHLQTRTEFVEYICSDLMIMTNDKAFGDWRHKLYKYGKLVLLTRKVSLYWF